MDSSPADYFTRWADPVASLAGGLSDLGAHPVPLVLTLIVVVFAVVGLHIHYSTTIGGCFISYAGSSNATLRVVFELRRVAGELGYKVFLDRECVAAGRPVDEAARRAVRRSRLFLAVVTEEYGDCEKCGQEMAFAGQSSGPHIIPVIVSPEGYIGAQRLRIAECEPIDLRGPDVNRAGLIGERLSRCAAASGLTYRLWLKLFRTSLYEKIWPLITLVPPEVAHSAALLALRIPLGRRTCRPRGEFEWRGLRFRSRIGIAAGLDKDAVALAGLEGLGVGFVEVGTVLLTPSPGLQDGVRMKRLLRYKAIWNRLGFPSQGVDTVRARLLAFSQERRRGMLVGCNIGPNPGNVKRAKDLSAYLRIAAAELCGLIRRLFEVADYFVVNLSSPNTPGLRGLLNDPRLCNDLLIPVGQALREMAGHPGGERPRLLLVKLPPEDVNRAPWSRQTLESVVGPIVEQGACDGFVATNTSTHLSGELAVGLGSDALPGGVSGAPLRPLAVNTVKLLRELVGGDYVIMGCGGVMGPEDVLEFLDAGAEVVQVYSGLIYRGPSLIRECALAT